MLKIENTEVVGWEHAIRGMRNPMNSWDKSDSKFGILIPEDYDSHLIIEEEDYWISYIGPKDRDLMMTLRRSGTDHRKFMRMITVYLDITAPLYWWKEFDTYKVGTVANSCSTMHKIHAKDFTLDDFSHEHLLDSEVCASDDPQYKMGDYYMPEYTSIDILTLIVEALNHYRNRYLDTKDKKYWWQLIQLLPSSYNQKRTVMLNYEVLANMFAARCNHKLDEWHTFCDWIKDLPYSELITNER